MMRLHVGRVRKKLSAMLAEHGLLIRPEHLDTNDGSLLRNPGNDLARWFGYANWRDDLQPERGLGCHLCRWDTMTDCVRYGFTLSFRKEDGFRHGEVSHKGGLMDPTPVGHGAYVCPKCGRRFSPVGTYRIGHPSAYRRR